MAWFVGYYANDDCVLARIPHRRVPGTRRCLFVERELHQWLGGAELDVVELPDHGRIVRVAQRL